MEEKMGFFKRIKTSVINFEVYKKFADEPIGKAIKYFFQIVLIFVIFATFSAVYPIMLDVKSVVKYVETDMPNFEISDGKLNVDDSEPISIERGSTLIYVDTKFTESSLNDFYQENKKMENVIIFSQDSVFMKLATNSQTIAYDYKTISDTTGINNITKQGVIDYFNNYGYVKISIALFIFMLLYLYLAYIIITILDVLILSALAFLTSKIYKISLNYKQCFSIAVYALTLSILLNSIYVILNSFTGFKIEYFQIMYNIISYIYVIAAILLIKTDYSKTGMDLMKIVEEIKNKEKDLEEKIDKPKEKEEHEETEDKTTKNDEKKETGTPEPNPGKA